MNSFRSPCKGFATNNAVFASVWLIFLLFVLILNFAQPGVDATQRLGSTACVIAFSALYFSALVRWITTRGAGTYVIAWPLGGLP